MTRKKAGTIPSNILPITIPSGPNIISRVTLIMSKGCPNNNILKIGESSDVNAPKKTVNGSFLDIISNITKITSNVVKK
jgi:hypothetical protein